MRKPELQETFNDEFEVTGKSPEWCMEESERLLLILRCHAAARGTEWLIKHGYFNGELKQTMTHKKLDSGKDVIALKVVMSCFGLPWAFEDAEDAISLLREESDKLLLQFRQMRLQRDTLLKQQKQSAAGAMPADQP